MSEANSMLYYPYDLDSVSQLALFIDSKCKGCSRMEVLTTIFLAKGYPGYSRSNERTLKKQNEWYLLMATSFLETAIHDVSTYPKTMIHQSMANVVKSSFPLDELARRLDSLMFPLDMALKAWVKLNNLDVAWDRARLMAGMLDIETDSKVTDPLCVHGLTLAACAEMSPDAKYQAWPDIDSCSEASTALILSGINELDVWDLSILDKTKFYRSTDRLIADTLEWADFLDILMLFLKGVKKGSICVFALDKKYVTGPEYEEWRSEIIKKHDVESVVKWKGCYLVKIRSRTKTGARTSFQDLSRRKFDGAYAEVNKRPRKGQRLLNNGDWIR